MYGRLNPRQIVLFLTLFWLAGVVYAGNARLDAVRVKNLDDRTRVVLDLSDRVTYTVFSLTDPERLVIDLESAKPAPGQRHGEVAEPVLARYRIGIRPRDGLRVVLDLSSAVRVEHFPLAPSGQRGERIVVDMYAGVARTTVQASDAGATSAPQSPAPTAEFVVAIDAGHGGRDPGAIGPRGTREKEVTLTIARLLRDLVNAEPGMRAVLTRSGDRYLKLRQRIEAARAQDADLFLSIHADSFRNKQARGSSVYVVSKRGASSEAARWLAHRENEADLAGGASLDGVAKEIQSVVLNMLQDHTVGDSMRVADAVLKNLKKVGKVHKPNVERAGFVVLKSPDIPSLLIEVGFLSNPDEERKLRDAKHQKRLAESIMKGVREYARSYVPARQTVASAQTHVVRRGETLGAIAQQYQISLGALRTANKMDGDLLYVGAKLTIPQDG
jgi:N-acetylmuramoyl-L-alanine amidase